MLLVGLVNLCAGTWATCINDTALAATALSAGLVFLLTATINRFEFFKGWGIEAKTRQLHQKIHQADDALQRLRELTETIVAVLINLNSKTGRWNLSPTPRDTIDLSKRLQHVMKKLGSDDVIINKTLYPWAKMLCLDMTLIQIKPLQLLVDEKLEKLKTEKQNFKEQSSSDDNSSEKNLSEKI